MVLIRVFNSFIETWSVFPLISLILAVYCLYQRYLNQPMTDGMPKLIFSFFLLGLFGYNAYTRTVNPEWGSNFSLLFVLLLLRCGFIVNLNSANAYAYRLKKLKEHHKQNSTSLYLSLCCKHSEILTPASYLAGVFVFIRVIKEFFTLRREISRYLFSNNTPHSIWWVYGN